MSMPLNRFSDIAAPTVILVPDDATRESLTVDYELGGIGLSDPSQGLQVQTWRARVDGSNVLVGPAPYTAETTLFTGADITEISLAFDQNMRPALAYIQDGQAKLRWFDSFVGETVTTTLDAGITSLFLTMDDKRDIATELNFNDILLFYIRGQNLYYRQQRDRFTTERLLHEFGAVGMSIARCGMNAGLRVQVEVFGRTSDLPVVGPGPDPDPDPDPVLTVPQVIFADLVAWWPLDDNAASPTYADLRGANPLTLRTGGATTNTSAISSASAGTFKHGRSSNLGRTDNRSAYIPRANTALDQANSDFSFGGWFRLGHDASTSAFVMGRLGSTGTGMHATITLEGSDGTLRAEATADGTFSTRVRTAGIASSIWSTSEMQFVVLTFNRAESQLELRFRRPGHSSGDLVKQVVPFPDALFTGASTSNFTISEGLSGDSTFFSSNRSGVFFADECFYASRAITDAEFDYLYASGAGKSYAGLVKDYTADQYPSYYASASLILWGFGSEGGTVFTDSSSVGRTVTAIGSATTAATAAKFGPTGLNFSTTGSGLSMAYTSDLDFSGGVGTLEAYLKHELTSGLGSIFDFRGSAAFNSGWMIYADFATRIIHLYHGPTNTDVMSTAANAMPPAGTYFHFRLTIDSGQVHFWIDGELAASATYVPPVTQPTGVRIGINSAGAAAWRGKMDAVIFSTTVKNTSAFTPPVFDL